MQKIRVKTPAKINLTLKVGHARPDGFHPIESVMAAIDLFDYIDIEVVKKDILNSVLGDNNPACPLIKIDSNSDEIPNNASNIAYKAAEKFFLTCQKAAKEIEYINIYIEKNIPVCAGLAGGSTNASGVVWGLNELFLRPLNNDKINSILETLGSDLNFCLVGGTKLCTGRGERLCNMPHEAMPITLIKPFNLKISAKEAYQKFDEAVSKGQVSNLPNDLEFALLPHYKELQFLHGLGFQMSGSGPTFFAKQAFLPKETKEKLKSDYLIIENLKTFSGGVLQD